MAKACLLLLSGGPTIAASTSAMAASLPVSGEGWLQSAAKADSSVSRSSSGVEGHCIHY